MNAIPNTNDGTQVASHIRMGIADGNLLDLPPLSTGPHGDLHSVYAAALAAGFQGIQGEHPAICRQLGLQAIASGRIDQVGDALRWATQWKQEGYIGATLHVGTGFETDHEAISLFQDVVTASAQLDFPLYVETHRATITQDMWRTIHFTQAVPAIRFNGDFSHWYTGQEMVYGSLDQKWEYLAPVFERVRFLHGRIGSPGSIQVAILPHQDLPAIAHFQEMWTRSCLGFLRSAQPGDYLYFVAELLGPAYDYARLIPSEHGEMIEDGDRWQEALAYQRLASECFQAAQQRRGMIA